MAVLHQNTMKQHSRSFYLAGLMLPRGTRTDVARLYAYCRAMDDAVDEHNRPEDVTQEKEALAKGQSQIAGLIRKHQIPSEIVEAFLTALSADTPPTKMENKKQLLAFCYGVAGTVGVMMCHVLGVKNRQALYHAIDLGIAMQLTNIARDRDEDEANNRYYFPPNTSQTDLVAMAEPYYKSGLNGICYLPLAVRPSVMAAALIYREIGQKILQNPKAAKTTRMVVPHQRKLTCALKGGIKSFLQHKSKRHDARLHQKITNFPYTQGQ